MTMAEATSVVQCSEEDASPCSEKSDETYIVENSPDFEPVINVQAPPEEQAFAKPKVKVLVRGRALCEENSPPPDDCVQSPTISDANTLTVDRCLSPLPNWQGKNGRSDVDNSTGSEAASPSLSRDSSIDMQQYTDSTGIDLEDFLQKTLKESPKDRMLLLRLEQELTSFIQDIKQEFLKFPQMSSYHRMLVHRVSAFFGLDHNVDQSGKCVVVNRTSNTRIPDFRFKEFVQDDDEPTKRQILKRECASFEESGSADRPSLAGKKSKSVEERREEYEEARARIFKEEKSYYVNENKEEIRWNSTESRPWSSTDSSGYSTDASGRARNNFITKANSFGGVSRTSSANSRLSKADSLSSGASSCLGSPMTRAPNMPSPESKLPEIVPLVPLNADESQPLAIWVASTLDSIPPGSIIIDPSSGKPYQNSDGSLYRYCPQPIQSSVPQLLTSQPPPPGAQCHAQPGALMPSLMPQQPTQMQIQNHPPMHMQNSTLQLQPTLRAPPVQSQVPVNQAVLHPAYDKGNLSASMNKLSVNDHTMYVVPNRMPAPAPNMILSPEPPGQVNQVGMMYGSPEVPTQLGPNAPYSSYPTGNTGGIDYSMASGMSSQPTMVMSADSSVAYHSVSNAATPLYYGSGISSCQNPLVMYSTNGAPLAYNSRSPPLVTNNSVISPVSCSTPPQHYIPAFPVSSSVQNRMSYQSVSALPCQLITNASSSASAYQYVHAASPMKVFEQLAKPSESSATAPVGLMRPSTLVAIRPSPPMGDLRLFGHNMHLQRQPAPPHIQPLMATRTRPHSTRGKSRGSSWAKKEQASHHSSSESIEQDSGQPVNIEVLGLESGADVKVACSSLVELGAKLLKKEDSQGGRVYAVFGSEGSAQKALQLTDSGFHLQRVTDDPSTDH